MRVTGWKDSGIHEDEGIRGLPRSEAVFTATKEGDFDAVDALLAAEPVLPKETDPQESAPEFFERIADYL